MSHHTIAGRQVVTRTDNESAMQAVANSFDGIIDTVSAKHDISQLLPLLKVKRLLGIQYTEGLSKPVSTPSLLSLMQHALPAVLTPEPRQDNEPCCGRADKRAPHPAGGASGPALLLCRRSAVQEVCLCIKVAHPSYKCLAHPHACSRRECGTLWWQPGSSVIGEGRTCRLTIAGSLIGGIKETQEMLDFCGKKVIGCPGAAML